jgi:hypothetical protein
MERPNGDAYGSCTSALGFEPCSHDRVVFGLVFFFLGMKGLSDFALLTATRIFVFIRAISALIVIAGLRAADALSGATWLDAKAVALHQRAGVLTLIVLITLAVLSGLMLGRSRKAFEVTTSRLRTAVVVLAMLGLGMILWTSSLGGELRHTEQRLGLQVSSSPGSR